tara:strand:- start:14927 stop:15253 length:327 start_codon:yes stop_codon:yes gene_type:complete
MSVVFRPGQELTENDLRVFLRDRQGTSLDSLTVRYSIYYKDGGDWVSLGTTFSEQTPEESDTAGKYWVDWEIEPGRTPGTYQIRWDFREGASSMWKQVRVNFAIVKDA